MMGPRDKREGRDAQVDAWNDDGAPSGRGRTRVLHLGVHVVEREEPDTCVVRFGGDLEERDVALILDAFEEFAGVRERAYLLIDLRGLGRATAEARRLAGMRQLPPQYAGLSLFGGSFEQQLVAKLATMAGWLLRGRSLGKPMPVCVKREGEARAWVAAQRGRR